MVKSGDLATLRAPLDFHYRWEGVGGSAQRLGDQTNDDGGRGRVSGGRSEGEKKNFPAGGRGVSGRKNEDFITGREQKQFTAVGAGGG